MLVRPPLIIRPSVLGGRIAGQAFGFPHAGPQAQPAATGGGGGGLPALPNGFSFVVDGNDDFVIHPDTNSYVIAETA